MVQVVADPAALCGSWHGIPGRRTGRFEFDEGGLELAAAQDHTVGLVPPDEPGPEGNTSI